MTRLFLALLSSLRRPWMVALVGIVIMAAAGATLVLAQTTAPRVLKVGETAGGSLDSKTFAQSYAFQAQAADVVTVTATTKTSGLTLALIVAGPDGNILGQASQAAKSTNVSLKDLKIPATGTYLITVLRASGANGTEKGDYTVALTGTSALTSSGTINLAKGLSVALSWQTTDYLSLEVRDPIGGSVNRHNATSQSGGTFAADTNADCASASASNPTDSVQWPAGNVPGGSYEIIVYYLQACANANPAASSTTPLLSAPQTQGTAAATQAVTVPPTPTLVSPPAASGGGDVNFTVTINV
ncbi:MAG TPA: hypothetical protein VKQ72_15405, partial [Aggregatilineales bacterium]|nr:hypothetical protein [Aggregatilineales bacterium]